MRSSASAWPPRRRCRAGSRRRAAVPGPALDDEVAGEVLLEAAGTGDAEPRSWRASPGRTRRALERLEERLRAQLGAARNANARAGTHASSGPASAVRREGRSPPATAWKDPAGPHVERQAVRLGAECDAEAPYASRLDAARDWAEQPGVDARALQLLHELRVVDEDEGQAVLGQRCHRLRVRRRIDHPRRGALVGVDHVLDDRLGRPDHRGVVDDRVGAGLVGAPPDPTCTVDAAVLAGRPGPAGLPRALRERGLGGLSSFDAIRTATSPLALDPADDGHLRAEPRLDVALERHPRRDVPQHAVERVVHVLPDLAGVPQRRELRGQPAQIRLLAEARVEVHREVEVRAGRHHPAEAVGAAAERVQGDGDRPGHQHEHHRQRDADDAARSALPARGLARRRPRGSAEASRSAGGPGCRRLGTGGSDRSLRRPF